MGLTRQAVEKVIRSFTSNLSSWVEGSELYKEANGITLEKRLFPCDIASIMTKDIAKQNGENEENSKEWTVAQQYQENDLKYDLYRGGCTC